MKRNNIIAHDEFNKLVVEVCDRIISVLSEHCGPYSRDAIIVRNDYNGRAHNIFTKDGIDIVDAIEFEDTHRNYIKSLISYMGRRIDVRAHDGTTTAMLMLTIMLKSICQNPNKWGDQGKKFFKKDQPTPKAIQHNLSTVFEHCRKIIEIYAITPERFAEYFKITDAEARRAIAYQQAMISSKGDHDLSTKIAEVIGWLPKELYSQYSFGMSRVETEERFTIRYQDCDFELRGILNPGLYRVNLGTEFHSDHCDVIASEDGFLDGNYETTLLLDYLDEVVGYKTQFDKQLERDLIIVSPAFDGKIQAIANNYNNRHATKIVTVNSEKTIDYSSQAINIEVMRTMAGVYSIKDAYAIGASEAQKVFLIRDAKMVATKGGIVRFDRLFERDGTMYHPFYTNPDRHPPYHLLINTLKKTIDQIVNSRGVVSDLDAKKLEDYVRYYRTLLCANQCYLEITGSTHDSYADRSVVQDAFGAVVASLESGFVLDGFSHLAADLSYNDPEFPLFGNAAQIAASKLVVSAIREISKYTYGIDEIDASEFDKVRDDSWRYVFANYYKRGKVEVTRISSQMTMEDLTSGEYKLLMQPVSGWDELLKRMKELIPRMATAVRSITPGVLVGEKKNGE